jgi:predicted GTPase
MSTAPISSIISFDKDQLRNELLDRLNELTTLLRGVEARHALGKDLLAELPRLDKQIRQHLEETFQLVILGDFKRGKSTLINALLQYPAVTTDVRPETVTINTIEYGSEPQVRALLESGAQATLRPDDLKRESLEPLLQKLPKTARTLRVTIPSQFLKELTVVDTPGLGDLFNEFDATVSNYLHHADAIIHVVSALSPLSQGEQEFLKVAVAPQNFPKIVFVVNMLDAMPSEKDAERVLKLIQAKLGALFPNAEVFGISGLDEWCRTQNKPRPNPDRAESLAARFQAFRAYLDEAVLFNRTLISSDRAVSAFEILVRSCARKVSLLREAMQVDRDRLAQTIASFESRNSELERFFEQTNGKLQTGIDALSGQAQAWMDEFLDRLETECTSALPKYPYEDVRKHFQFFLVEVLRTAFEGCLSAHQEALADLLESTRQDLAKNLSAHTLTSGRSLELTAKAFNDLPWGNLAVLQLAAELVFGVGFVVKLVLGHVRNVHEQSQTAKLADMLRQEMPKLRAEVAGQVRNVYARIGREMLAQLRAAYESDRAATLESMKQAQEVGARGEAGKSDTERTLNVIAEALDSGTQFLQEFRQKLWTGAEALA